MERPAWLAAIACLVAGAAAGDCAVIAAAGPLFVTGFYLRMDADAPMDPFRMAVRCVLAGSACLTASIALLALVLAAAHGLWTPTHDRHYADVGVLAACVAAMLIAMQRRNARAVHGGLRAAAEVVAAAAILSVLVPEGLEWSLCALPVAVAGLLAMTGWRLMVDVAGGVRDAELAR